ncbi:MAG TPA: META domain-containing protein, partial [Povalibacter sp.]
MDVSAAFQKRLCGALLLIVLGTLAACAKKPTEEAAPQTAPAEPASASSLTGTIADLGGPSWKLESFDASDPVPEGVLITLALEGERVSGQGGCNRYMGSIRNGDGPGKIAFGPLAMTKMACEPPLDAAETRYSGALQQATSFSVEGRKLLIHYTQGDQT